MTQGPLTFQKIRIRNFLSFGFEPATFHLDTKSLVTIMGENHDTGGEDSRNGVGKSTVIDALSYAIFGKSVRGIANPRLPHKWAKRGQSMIVELWFTRGEHEYHVVRGEKPSRLNLYRKPLGDERDILDRDPEDEHKMIFEVTRSTKPETSSLIEDIVGLDMLLFEFLVANTSESIPFLKLPDAQRRGIMERLLGFTKLTEWSEQIKAERRVTKKEITAEESRIETTRQANLRVKQQIDKVERASTEWETRQKDRIQDQKDTIEALEQIDHEDEVETLKLIQDIRETVKTLQQDKRILNQKLSSLDTSSDERLINRVTTDIEGFQKQIESIEGGVCPTCDQPWTPEHDKVDLLKEKIAKLKQEQNEAQTRVQQNQTERKTHEDALAELQSDLNDTQETLQETEAIELIYDSPEEAAGNVATLKHLKEQLEGWTQEENPHTETLSGLKEQTTVAIDETGLEELHSKVQHQNLLIELLTSNDSFIRRTLLNQFLPALNQKIAKFLSVLELPHRVSFGEDLDIHIQHREKDFDWPSLSRGQRHRVGLALNFAFQEFWAKIAFPINLLMVDELLDSGICNRGAEASVNLLEEMTHNGSSVFLITHREDISARVEDTITIILKNDRSRLLEDEFDED